MIDYQWIRKAKNRRMYLRVKEGVVVVTTPSFVSRQEVDQFVQAHREWIHKQMNKKIWRIRSGDLIQLLGQRYRVIEDQSFYISNGKLHIVHDEKKWRSFIQSIAHDSLEKRLYDWASDMGYSDITLKFGFYKSKWGSCRKDRYEIRLNYFLALCDWDEIDAIIVHELCHLKVSDHSRRFYQEVYRWLPNYKSVYDRLKKVEIPEME